ncbi:Penicillin-binding protein 1A [Streptomyces lavendulae subsp. lavendulae]|uniref:Penicillin-binding protein 1A n=2 Tax=Streptomyces lavendulae TaxID=1914 RepID=A0A2K8PQI5_STRLA|nr:transglycosylase domain-containing protein [Streptomyces lavendulae]ATZ28708.1 Penicillin-binding protein 1A [Streptomyces lavendulae subsp. lavendulae]QUQ58533.1 Penicillin-binding protein 1A [Streptomyces lavendulae subsp. lavendulae]
MVPDNGGGAPSGRRGSSGSRRKPRAAAGRRITLPPALVEAATTAAAKAVAAARPWLRRLRPAYPRPGRTGWRRWAPSWRQWLGACLYAFTGMVGFVAIAYATTDIPDDLNSFAKQQDNIYYWADGSTMARTGWVSRQEMPLDKVPPKVQGAVLAAENASFYSDPGVSPSGVLRAVRAAVTGGETQGGSTITQQYVKNAYLSQERTLSRKFTELLLAVKLDNQKPKKQILQDYLNTSWFGRGTYGIQRASQAYYGKDVSQLNASEGAFLASLLKGAGLFDPALGKENRERAVERWSWILDRMVETGQISAAERATYKTFPEPSGTSLSGTPGAQTGYLVELAKQYAVRSGHIKDSDFDLGGYQVYTTFDQSRMTALTAAVQNAQKGFDAEKRPDTDKHAKIGAASVAPDGRLLAVYGGPDYLKQGFNESNATTIPAGSAFTPLVYAAGLDEGVLRTRGKARTPLSPTALYDGNDQVTVQTPEGPYWDRSGKVVKGRNDGGRNWGQVTLRQAVANSVNTPMLQLGLDVGLDRVEAFAERSGLLASSLGPRIPTFALGENSTPSAIRMAGAYETFAADGMHTDPYSVRSVTRNGAAVPLDAPKPVRAVSAKTARAVTEALRDAVTEGSAKAAGKARPGAAGKTGTTAANTAGWFVASTEQESTAVVVYRMALTDLIPLPLTGLGGDAPGTPGSDRAVRLWADYVKAVK